MRVFLTGATGFIGSYLEQAVGSGKTERDERAVSEHLGRPVRADARRNVQALLKTAMMVFAT